MEVQLTIFNKFSSFLCLCKTIQEMLLNLFSVNFLSRPNIIQHHGHFLLEFLILGMMYTQLAGDVTWRESLLFSHTKLSHLGRWAFGSQPSAVITRVLNKNAASWQTRNNKKLPKHKLSQNAKKLQCLLKFGLIEDNVTVFQWPWNSESG